MKCHDYGSTLKEITAHTQLQSVISFDEMQEKDYYCNFLKLHLIKKHGKAVKRRQLSDEAVERIFWWGFLWQKCSWVAKWDIGVHFCKVYTFENVAKVYTS